MYSTHFCHIAGVFFYRLLPNLTRAGRRTGTDMMDPLNNLGQSLTLERGGCCTKLTIVKQK
uniref:Uncharacterized protein n=1 Tax=Timema poppense TaxID=170557 RepID=A0A7R9DUR5_TIMPO|nr:unnamed protein product [Timema poppensis]